MSQHLEINGQRFVDSLFELGQHGALEGGGVCRLAATPEDKAGRDFVVDKMQALGLSVKIDAIGNVTGIYAGQQELPMAMRHDAGLAAAKIAVFARELAQKFAGDQVSTVGHMTFKPNLINVIPNHVVMSVDLRNTDNEELKRAERQLLSFVEKTAQEEGISITTRSLVRFNPVIFADEIVDAVEKEAQMQGLSHRRLPSGAGHDAQFMASVCPAGMIFVPCVGGISHNVKEHTESHDLIAGANVLLQVVLKRAERSL
ncbi:M20/M25/M40 family metallo-hydrolase [Klebsiella sp. MISC125]|uniref:M20/M25/M40 family metallo-hydrolase n=1 Tax=Klebsiella sp. MISC125 TaxID=2755386 RepID=UPI003DA91924